MNYENQDWEMSFKDMLFFVLYKWKKIVLVGLALGLVLGGFQAFQTMSNPVDLQKAEAKYQQQMDKYNRERDVLEGSISSAKLMVENQKDYLLNSTLMQLGTHNVYEAKADLYITTDYQIMPDMVYQNEDNSGSIIAVYESVLKNNDVIYQVAEKVSMDTKHLKELITVTDVTNHVLEIIVLHNDVEKAEQVLDLLIEHIEATKPTADRIIGEHKVEVLLRTSGPYVDNNGFLAGKREKQEQYLADYEENLEVLEQELKELKKTKPSMNKGSSVLQTGAKWAAIGVAVGAVLAVVYYCVVFVFRTTVYSAEELAARIGIRSLGCVIAEDVRYDVLTRLMRKKEGRIVENSDRNAALVAQTVRNYCTTQESVLVAGRAEPAAIQMLTENLRPYLADIKLTPTGSLLKDADAVSGLRQCDAVLLVESCGKTKYKTIGLERERIEDAGKNCSAVF